MTRITTPADLKTARQRLNLTQRQVADFLGVPSNTVSRLERGETVRGRVKAAGGYPTAAFDSRWRSHLTLLFEALNQRETRNA